MARIKSMKMKSIFLSYFFRFIHQPGSRQIQSRQPSSKRSAIGQRENEKGVKSLVLPIGTEITGATNNE
jgi:hypothetical protein